jgi:hypothetical protein
MEPRRNGIISALDGGEPPVNVAVRNGNLHVLSGVVFIGRTRFMRTKWVEAPRGLPVQVKNGDLLISLDSRDDAFVEPAKLWGRTFKGTRAVIDADAALTPGGRTFIALLTLGIYLGLMSALAIFLWDPNLPRPVGFLVTASFTMFLIRRFVRSASYASYASTFHHASPNVHL